ncbi:MAG: hypothetical protein QOF89_4974 [Acidobacteriota bacterium]|jgi:hypothetical protein|nr:hypothetical protein [Acidobacteriota bacterium]
MNAKKVLLPVSIVAVSLAAALAAGCGGKQTPVARVEVDPRLVQLPFSQARTVRLTWTPSAPLEGETPTVFVHLLDDKKKVSRTFDHPFPQRWREGSPITDDFKVYQSALAPPLPAGRYQVVAGLYGKDGKRWALDGLGETVGRDEYNAFQIEVPAQSPGPRFAFSPTWGPVDPGGDRQVVARRWMADQGAIRVLDQPGPGVVWLVVQIPAMDRPDYRLALAPGASVPTLLVRSNCGGTEANLSGPGIHEVEVVMDTPPPDGVCRVELSANFTLQSQRAVGGKRSISLENIAWVAGGVGSAGGARPAPQPAGAGTPSSPSAPQ